MEQFERVKRYYERFKEIDEGKQHCLNSAYYEDDVYSFFINCHHLKDWIKNDPTVAINKKDVEDYVKANSALLICADMCNGAKHLERIPNSIVSGKKRSIDSKVYSVAIMEGSAHPPNITIKFFIDNLDAFKVATECVQKWEEFIKKNII
jgi:23S rRNA maturation mini-RNase III